MSVATGETTVPQALDKDLLQALLDVSGLLVVMLDEVGRIQLFNRACEELTGFSATDVIGHPIWSCLIPEDELTDVKDVHGRLQRDETSNIHVNHWLTKDGNKRLIQWRNVSLRDDEGRLCGLVGTGIDMTEQERALRVRRHWEAERHYLLDALPILIAHVDEDFRIRFANNGYRHWFGLDADDLAGKPIVDVIGDAAFATLEPHFRTALGGRRSIYHGEMEYLHGPKRFIHGTYIPAFDEATRIDGFYIVVVDLSEQHHLRETLVQERLNAQREAQAHLLELSHVTRVAALSEVAAGLAHEISQPLTAIAASAEACLMQLSRTPESAERLRPAIDEIAKQGQRARQIIQQLRSFLHKEQEDSRSDCDIRELIDDVLLLLKTELVAEDIVMERDLDPELCRLRVNRVQVEQVLFNLLRNAIEVLSITEGDRRVVIRSRCVPEQGRYRIEVSDSGPGLDEAAIPKLFHPFYTTKTEGLGQGLSICRSIIDRHGGELEAANSPDGGAVFSFTLPLCNNCDN
ncbi:PAS domain-containing protein [Wenzhouxiangella sp. XN201]|uniref:PAS domain-containing sensor histidine kinase n=1 Tax=Wenzhouxiangella sp. XN201 TaxID=2710755 RepID=UPI0013CAE8A9|nr:PAS domain-containing sensor histidine kinase [Wenzhouxiangella sp. XN201]NEZ03948.1 PAS domain-containing protein [Wenzhouxiangella sp. XN201]